MGIDWEGIFGEDAYDDCGDDLVNLATYGDDDYDDDDYDYDDEDEDYSYDDEDDEE